MKSNFRQELVRLGKVLGRPLTEEQLDYLEVMLGKQHKCNCYHRFMQGPFDVGQYEDHGPEAVMGQGQRAGGWSLLQERTGKF